MVKFLLQLTIIFAIGFSIPISKLVAQESTKTDHLRKNSIFLEFGGNALFKSLNYDRVLVMKEGKIKGILRIGFGYFTSEYDTTTVAILPFEATILKGKHSNYLEIGFGYTGAFGKFTTQQQNRIYRSANYYDYYFFRVGYRYQDLLGRSIFRIGITPYLYHDYVANGKLRIGLWGGLSAGYSF